ncbi:MAG: hypothetical protein ACE5K8_07410 [Candidatus Zixiibacteriota bacterium]
MKRLSLILSTLFVLVFLSIDCTEKTPSRDLIPVLKESIYLLQEALKARNQAAIDSLMTPEILTIGQNSDSLIRFVYGSEDQFTFERFGNCEIVYTADIARISCFIMDSTSRTDRPIVFTLVNRHDLWLLKRFEAGQRNPDTL